MIAIRRPGVKLSVWPLLWLRFAVRRAGLSAPRAVLAVALPILLLAAPAQAQQLKIGFVDAGKLLESAPQAEQAREQLETEFGPRDKALVEAQKELRAMEDNLASDTRMSEAERRQLDLDIRRQKREIDRGRQEFREEFNIRRNEELRLLQRLVYDTIVKLAKDEEFDLIVNDGAVIFAGPKVDITDRVLQLLK